MLVGTWTGEGVYAADYPGVGKKGEKFTTTFTCRWTAGRAAIACEGKDTHATWTSLYFWNPATKQIRVSGVDSGGNYDEGTVVVNGKTMTYATAGHFADGQKVEYQRSSSYEQNGSIEAFTGKTILKGIASPFDGSFKKVPK